MLASFWAKSGSVAAAIKLTNTVFMLFSFTMFCLNESYVLLRVNLSFIMEAAYSNSITKVVNDLAGRV